MIGPQASLERKFEQALSVPSGEPQLDFQKLALFA
jgi:hypothetical protein